MKRRVFILMVVLSLVLAIGVGTLCLNSYLAHPPMWIDGCWVVNFGELRAYGFGIRVQDWRFPGLHATYAYIEGPGAPWSLDIWIHGAILECPLLVVPLWWCWLRWRGSKRKHIGLCVKCSYDLQAHKPGDHCPECGKLIAIKSAIEAGT